VGGISKTVNYRGNRMDLGGHRFFSKSDWVMNWWQEMLPVAQDEQRTARPSSWPTRAKRAAIRRDRRPIRAWPAPHAKT
jgi:protoporphyrinogen oxidase